MPRSETRAPARVVALAPSAVEILFALGAGDRVVAVPDTTRLPAARSKVHVGGFAPDLERVVALSPDLVVVSRDGTARTSFERLKSLGLNVLVTGGSTLPGVLDDILSVGDAISEPGPAARLVASLRRRIAAAEARAALRPGPPPRVLVVIWPHPPVVAGPDTFIGDLVRRARLSNVVPSSAGEWPQVSFETLASWNPDLLIRPETPEDTDVFREAFTSDPLWRLVPAVRDGRVVALSGDALERPGPRLVDALEELVNLGGGP